MASASQVREYLAYWFQLGKPIVFQDSQQQWLPSPVFYGSGYSEDFELCWQQILQDTSECYLAGTHQTVAVLLSGDWDVVGCARCEMPVPLPVHTIASNICPCNDLPTWPNEDIPKPRPSVNNTAFLGNLCNRLSAANTERDRLRSAYDISPNFPVADPGTSGAASIPNEGLESPQEVTKAKGS